MRKGGNPNIANISREKSTGPKTEIGKFLQAAGRYTGDEVNAGNLKSKPIPNDLKELYVFFKGKGMEGIDQLKKLRDLSLVLEQLAIPKLLERLIKGEVPDKRELETLRLLKETLVDSFKLEYGEKKTITHEVTVHDLRRQMMSDKTIIDAKLLNETNKPEV